MVASDWVLSMGQIQLKSVITENVIFEIKCFYICDSTAYC